jgi:hypothetical protein
MLITQYLNGKLWLIVNQRIEPNAFIRDICGKTSFEGTVVSLYFNFEKYKLSRRVHVRNGNTGIEGPLEVLELRVEQS